jgi:DeoR family ulaG and ulaABCDEF operon transcriptional repressor
VLADSSKLGKRSNFIFSSLSDVDVLITDSNADPDLVRLFESQGIEVIIVAAVVDVQDIAVETAV